MINFSRTLHIAAAATRGCNCNITRKPTIFAVAKNTPLYKPSHGQWSYDSTKLISWQGPVRAHQKNQCSSIPLRDKHCSD